MEKREAEAAAILTLVRVARKGANNHPLMAPRAIDYIFSV